MEREVNVDLMDGWMAMDAVVKLYAKITCGTYYTFSPFFMSEHYWWDYHQESSFLQKTPNIKIIDFHLGARDFSFWWGK